MFPKSLNGTVGGIYGRKETYTFVALFRYKTGRVGRKAEDAYLYPRTLYHGIWLHKPFAHSTCKVVVGTHYGKRREPEQTCKVVEPEIEFVVAYSARIVPHYIHRFNLYCSFVGIVVERAL